VRITYYFFYRTESGGKRYMKKFYQWNELINYMHAFKGFTIKYFEVYENDVKSS
jgi:hypothetical protein